MAETNNGSLILQQSPAFQSLLHSLDPISLILSQNQNPDSEEPPVQLRLTTESFIMERGPRYRAYAELRESRLRMKNSRPYEAEAEAEEEELKLTLTPPLKKQVKFQTNLDRKSKGSSTFSSSSVVAKSVPDFSSMLRKENRKPPAMEMTTPPAKSLLKAKSLSNSRGSKSANSGDNKKNLMMARKSYASLEELKGFSSAAANAINGENRGGGRRVLGYRAF